MNSHPRASIIAAVARNRVIGSGNALPWRLPEDLKRFRSLTLGHSVIMGRKTFESIVALSGKPLEGRLNIVITRSRAWSAGGARVVHSLAEALAAAPGNRNAFVIGGAEIYTLALPVATRLFLTEIDQDFHGDSFFPEFDRSSWRLVSREPLTSAGVKALDFAFVEYERIT